MPPKFAEGGRAQDDQTFHVVGNLDDEDVDALIRDEEKDIEKEYEEEYGRDEEQEYDVESDYEYGDDKGDEEAGDEESFF